MGGALWAIVGGTVVAVVGQVAPRRSVALQELQAALAEQRTQLATQEQRIVRLEAEVADCEQGRTRDREAFATQLAELRGRLTGS